MESGRAGGGEREGGWWPVAGLGAGVPKGRVRVRDAPGPLPSDAGHAQRRQELPAGGAHPRPSQGAWSCSTDPPHRGSQARCRCAPALSAVSSSIMETERLPFHSHAVSGSGSKAGRAGGQRPACDRSPHATYAGSGCQPGAPCRWAATPSPRWSRSSGPSRRKTAAQSSTRLAWAKRRRPALAGGDAASSPWRTFQA